MGTVGDHKKPSSQEELLNKSLAGFTVQLYTEVYKTDVEGMGKTKSLGFFKDNDIAVAFVKNQTDAAWHKTEQVYLLTNGEVGFKVGEQVQLVDNEKVLLEVKAAALAKLTPSERKILGL